MEKEREGRPKKPKRISLNIIYWISCFLYKFGYQVQMMEDSKEEDERLLNGYQLTTRQLPPSRILLLKDDILVLYLFDYTSHPPLKDEVTADFYFNFVNQYPFYTFHENKNQPNLSYVLIDANKITTKDPVPLSYSLSATFNLNNKTKNDSKEYKMTIQLIDKDNVTEANFENFEEGFTFRMRSNDTNAIFPMNSDHIFGDKMNLKVKQIDEESSKTPKIEVKIGPRSTIHNVSFYKKFLNSRIIDAMGLSLKSDAVIRQRTDKPSLFKLDFFTYDSFGNLNNIESLIFDDLELVKTMKINAYTHVTTLNSGKHDSYMVIFILKVGPRDPLPITRLVYPNYKLVYYKIGLSMHDSSYSRKNFQVIWVYKLQKFTRSNSSETWEQNVYIYGIYLSDQSIRQVGMFRLAGLKGQLDAKFEVAKAYANITCTKIEVFSRFRGVLGCQLLPSQSGQQASENEPLEVFISIQMIMASESRKFSFVVEDIITSTNPQGEHIKASTLINFWHTENTRSNEKFLIKPFALIYYRQGDGYYMKSHTSEWIELIKGSEMEEGFQLMNTMCHSDSKTLILEFQKQLKKKRAIPQDTVKRTWSKSLTYFLNLDSKYRGNDRIITNIDKDLPIDKETPQVFEASYIKESGILACGIILQIGKIREIYFRIAIDRNYPRITLSTNSTKNFTANMKIYLNRKSEVTEGVYGFPFKVEAKAAEKFTIEPREDKDIPVLMNGRHNLEEYFKIRGPMNSIQQVTTDMGRLKFVSRSFWGKTSVIY